MKQSSRSSREEVSGSVQSSSNVARGFESTATTAAGTTIGSNGDETCEGRCCWCFYG